MVLFSDFLENNINEETRNAFKQRLAQLLGFSAPDDQYFNDKYHQIIIPIFDIFLEPRITFEQVENNVRLSFKWFLISEPLLNKHSTTFTQIPVNTLPETLNNIIGAILGRINMANVLHYGDIIKRKKAHLVYSRFFDWNAYFSGAVSNLDPGGITTFFEHLSRNIDLNLLRNLQFTYLDALVAPFYFDKILQWYARIPPHHQYRPVQNPRQYLVGIESNDYDLLYDLQPGTRNGKLTKILNDLFDVYFVHYPQGGINTHTSQNNLPIHMLTANNAQWLMNLKQLLDGLQHVNLLNQTSRIFIDPSKPNSIISAFLYLGKIFNNMRNFNQYYYMMSSAPLTDVHNSRASLINFFSFINAIHQYVSIPNAESFSGILQINYVAPSNYDLVRHQFNSGSIIVSLANGILEALQPVLMDYVSLCGGNTANHFSDNHLLEFLSNRTRKILICFSNFSLIDYNYDNNGNIAEINLDDGSLTNLINNLRTEIAQQFFDAISQLTDIYISESIDIIVPFTQILHDQVIFAVNTPIPNGNQMTIENYNIYPIAPMIRPMIIYNLYLTLEDLHVMIQNNALRLLNMMNISHMVEISNGIWAQNLNILNTTLGNYNQVADFLTRYLQP